MVDTVKIRTLRLALGLTMQQAAELSGMRFKQSWYQLESDKEVDPKVSTLYRVATALQVSIYDLIKHGGDENGRH